MKYKIGEIARLAGVSRRTIDYYTSLGLLKPFRSESNYRYYSEEALMRLKLIEDMKEKRLTLGEIREQLDLLFENVSETDKENRNNPATIDFLMEQFKQLQKQLAQLQPAATGMDPKQATLLSKQIFLQSLTLIQSLMLYINEITPEVTPYL